MTTKSNREIGKDAEELASVYLETKGYTILDRNYFFEHAEVDIVAFQKDTSQIVFVEVKWRSSTDFGQPEDSISDSKIERIYKAAEAWIYERKMDGAPVRFDVISIVQEEDNAPDIKHFEDAFWMPGIS